MRRIIALIACLPLLALSDTLSYFDESELVDRSRIYTGNVAGFGVRFDAGAEWSRVSVNSMEFLFSSRLHSSYGGPLPMTIPFIVHEAISDSAPGPGIIDTFEVVVNDSLESLYPNWTQVDLSAHTKLQDLPPNFWISSFGFADMAWDTLQPSGHSRLYSFGPERWSTNWDYAVRLIHSGIIGDVYDLPDDSTSYAVLISDYETLEFEGGKVINGGELERVDSLDFPMVMDYRSPVDFGFMTILSSTRSDTLFHGTIVWAGMGEMIIPRAIHPASTFGRDSVSAREPHFLGFINNGGNPITEDSTMLKADSVWTDLSKLSLTHQFAEYGYSALVCLYMPSVGVVGVPPQNAKFITFLYRNPLTMSIGPGNNKSDSPILFNTYPNPFNPSTTISYDLPEHSHVKLTIYDVNGREVVTLQDNEKPAGHFELQWNGTDARGNKVSTGVYFARLQAGAPQPDGVQFSETIKMVFLQ
ncbi:MAG: T9SS type A sorting domain-containing protein [Candidatus Marinimicrobia bacterium]|nr:T9SS type A sorting domain-containing protein [Candidatus Neomarinimicrobiota bacterium]MCF7850315.1 T9SS type A sorting domain-containing protein [Candidatus Neomarinimicrobiota bacterium]MCF7903907.1 T9SS type A sorting domain-containing protein [Candidatus Neomarinimicrobiota bacterium]